jgi:hypothetical protein
MAKLTTQVFRDWALGVITSLRPDELPLNASPRGRDSALVSVGAGRCIVGKRRGAELAITEMVPSAKSVMSQFLFHHHHADGSAGHRFHLFTDNDTNLYWKDDDGEITLVDAAATSADTLPPVWAQIKNMAFYANGEDKKKVIEDTSMPVLQEFGITRPAAPTATQVVGGGVADAAGTWRVAITYYNSDTGHESSLSDYDSVTINNSDRISVTWATPADTQVTHVRVYVLREGTTTDYLGDYTNWQFVIGTSPENISPSLAGLNNLFDLSPTTTSNDPPPDNIKGVVSHLSRAFVWDNDYIYWSAIDEPEAFDLTSSYQPVDLQDGSPIVACHKVDDNLLAIFKEDSLYGLYGTDPNSWELRLIDPSVGATSPYAIVTIEGYTYFWSKQGPMSWDHGSAPQQIGYAAIQPTVEPEAIYYPNANRIIAVADPPRQRVMFGFPTADATMNNTVLPFNYRLRVWEADAWQPFDACSFLLAEDGDNRFYVWVGGYFGHIFKWWVADTDGCRPSGTSVTVSSITRASSTATVTTSAAHHLKTGNIITMSGADQAEYNGEFVLTGAPTSTTFTYTVSGTPVTPATGAPVYTSVYTIQGTIESATSSTITVGADDNLDSDRLVGLYAYAVDPTNQSVQRRRITAVDASTKAITVTPNWSTTPIDDSDWTYVLSGPMFEWDTKWDDYNDPFTNKRMMMLYADAICDAGNTEAYIDVFMDSSTTSPSRTFTFPLSGSGAVFDEDGFDEGVFGAEAINALRRRIAKIGRTYRYRIRHYENNRQLVLLKLGNSAHLLTDRRS